MPWVRIKGLPGMVFEPEEPPPCRRKHNCRDCFSCQMCDDVRCDLCRRRNSKKNHTRRSLVTHLH